MTRTPGPWRVQDGRKLLGSLSVLAGPKLTEGGTIIADVRGKPSYADANALAIAGLPDLIDAARRFLEAREMVGWREGECDLFLGPIWHAVQDALRACGEEGPDHSSCVVDGAPNTRAIITWLGVEAGGAGNLEWVAICARALAGEREATEECRRVIRVAIEKCRQGIADARANGKVTP